MARGITIPSSIEDIINPFAPAEAKVPGLGEVINPLAGAEANTYNAAGGVSGVTDFLSRLDQPNLWIRVGEFAVGMILLYVGLRTAFPSEVAAATGPAKTAVKVGTMVK